MRILVVFTGGTIGSAVSDGFIAPQEAQRYKLIEAYRQIAPYHVLYSGVRADNAATDLTDTIQFDTVEPYVILSENLNGSYLNRLVSCLKNYAEGAAAPFYDGIIVTHGTDTLQYTSAALGYAFADAGLPIVLVSSNYILDDNRANGLDNFYYAVEFIMKQKDCGVFVSYRNGTDKQLIHRAARLLPHAPYDDLVHSIDGSCYGYFSDGTFTREVTRHTESMSVDNTPDSRDSNQIEIPDFSNIQLSEHAPVLYIRALPGQGYPTVASHIRSVLLDSFHSGTLCTAGDDIRRFMADARKRKIPVFLTGAEQRIAYASTRQFAELGIHVLPKASPIAMYMKLWYLCCSDCPMLPQIMRLPIGGDIDAGQG